MKTLADAERASWLGNERRILIERRNYILGARWISLSRGDPRDGSPAFAIRVEVFTDKARQLLIEEVQAQVAKIDEELRGPRH